MILSLLSFFTVFVAFALLTQTVTLYGPDKAVMIRQDSGVEIAVGSPAWAEFLLTATSFGVIPESANLKPFSA
jgi:hypothetical protein